MQIFKKIAPAVTVFLLAAGLCVCVVRTARGQDAAEAVTESAAVEKESPLFCEASRDVTETVTVEAIAIPAQELRYVSPELAAGEETVLREGRAGCMEETVLITYKNGRKLTRTVLSRRTLKEPADTVILYGVDRSASVRTHPADPTASGGILLTPQGDRLSYTRVLSCTATAYSCEGRVGTTAIGTTARVGAVAVDPDYIPYGTKMYIVSDDGAYVYGYATAEDCGNFRGYHVDLYFDTVDECWTFGRRTCTVYILS